MTSYIEIIRGAERWLHHAVGTITIAGWLLGDPAKRNVRHGLSPRNRFTARGHTLPLN